MNSLLAYIPLLPALKKSVDMTPDELKVLIIISILALIIFIVMAIWFFRVIREDFFNLWSDHEGKILYLAITMGKWRDALCDTGFSPHFVYGDDRQELWQYIEDNLEEDDKLVALDVIQTVVDTPVFTYMKMEDADLVNYVGVDAEKYRRDYFGNRIDREGNIVEKAPPDTRTFWERFYK